jgi:tripartite-type tricarboxylate transporter receptor subunit TctC
MGHSIRKAFAQSLTALFLLTCSSVVQAESSYPSRSVQFITPYPPGGIADNSFRVIQPFLARKLGATLVDINKPGAGGLLAADYVRHAKPDGYTIFNGANVIFTTLRAMKPKLAIPANHFAVIGTYTMDPSIAVSRKDAPWKNMKELIAYAKAHPGKLNVGDGGVGGAGHFTLEALKLIFNLNFIIIHYQGANALKTAILGHQVDVVCASTSTFLPLLKSGDLIGLAVTAKHPELPQVPSFDQIGASDAEFNPTQAFYVPSGTPKFVVSKLRRALSELMKDPGVLKAMHRANLLPHYRDASSTSRELDLEYSRAKKIVEKLAAEKK